MVDAFKFARNEPANPENVVFSDGVPNTKRSDLSDFSRAN